MEGIVYQRQFVKCGKSSCNRCPHGPYWYAFWWDAKKSCTRSKYVGKNLPEGVNPSETVVLQEPLAPPPAAPPAVPPMRKLTAEEAWALIGLAATRNVGMVRARVNGLLRKLSGGGKIEGIERREVEEAWSFLCNENGWKE